MSTQPEALRLADALMEEHPFPRDIRLAAAELRFLHAENEELRRERDEARRTVREAHEAGTRLHAQRDALLEALKSTGLFLHHCWCDVQMNDYSFEKLNQQMAVVDTAIKMVEEGK